jgi:CheY-like chemotaxis protein
VESKGKKMNKEVVILVTEDDKGHFSLIKKNLQRAGIWNEMLMFADGQELLDFLFMKGDGLKRDHNTEYLLLLDIRMPRMNGIEVLERIKQDEQLKKIPVIILTTTDDPLTVERSHSLGCSIYIVKPVEYESFIDTIQKIGSFLTVVRIPRINGVNLTTGVF